MIYLTKELLADPAALATRLRALAGEGETRIQGESDLAAAIVAMLDHARQTPEPLQRAKRDD